jgi:LmbE family N-acetylglucosaminyl deacetylase
MITRRVALTSSPRRHPHPDHHHDFAGALGIGRDRFDHQVVRHRVEEPGDIEIENRAYRPFGSEP